MKYIVFLVLTLAVVSGCAVLGGSIPAGDVREGTGQGYRGPIVVQVRLSGGSVAEITVVDSVEDRFVGEAAIEDLIDTVIDYNSADIDVVSGATITSNGFLEAVRNAIMNTGKRASQ
ncbi:MAG: FMN-binding protein [Treponema sp.]|jgi:uncharacterized protein with FMN-binding domain|nr:FMN-binding protein [Treponema sp.]